MVGHCFESSRAFTAYRVRFPGSPNFPRMVERRHTDLKHRRQTACRCKTCYGEICSHGEIVATLVSKTSVSRREGATPSASTISACDVTAAMIVLETIAFGRVGATPTKRTNLRVDRSTGRTQSSNLCHVGSNPTRLAN